MNINIPGKIKSVEQYTKLLKDYPKGVEGLKSFFSNHDFPVTLGLHFVRPNKQEFKYTNLINIVVRALYNMGIIPSDGCKSVMPVILPIEKNGIPEWWTVNKKKQGVVLSIIEPQDIISPPQESNGVIYNPKDVEMDDSTTLKTGSIFGD